MVEPQKYARHLNQSSLYGLKKPIPYGSLWIQIVSEKVRLDPGKKISQVRPSLDLRGRRSWSSHRPQSSSLLAASAATRGARALW